MSIWRRFIEACWRENVPIILDNAGSEDQVKHLIAGDTTAFIITSRNALALDGVRPLRIDVFSDKKALELLRAIVGAKGSNAELHKVAELCGRLPLALRVAGDFCASRKDGPCVTTSRRWKRKHCDG